MEKREMEKRIKISRSYFRRLECADEAVTRMGMVTACDIGRRDVWNLKVICSGSGACALKGESDGNGDGLDPEGELFRGVRAELIVSGIYRSSTEPASAKVVIRKAIVSEYIKRDESNDRGEGGLKGGRSGWRGAAAMEIIKAEMMLTVYDVRSWSGASAAHQAAITDVGCSEDGDGVVLYPKSMKNGGREAGRGGGGGMKEKQPLRLLAWPEGRARVYRSCKNELEARDHAKGSVYFR
ncbi:hypothetical protein DFH09DRAFT_1089196 [Mycena vulgaris]|nr:hypothetical protein DFH09DRAFT_1089196 [Mycena vulgaris]